MSILVSLWILIQVFLNMYLVLPLLLYICFPLKKKKPILNENSKDYDYGIIVTAFLQVDMIPSVVNSILALDYQNYLVYVVADNCDTSLLKFDDQRVVILKPEHVLASNTESHFYAIRRFQRAHQCLTIIDSDNLVDRSYLNELNLFFDLGYKAIQGQRRAKNLNTSFACLDEAGDMYYRLIDRKLLFNGGSSASLAGSGMAFKTDFYKQCLEHLTIKGAGFDKVLQMEVLHRGERVAFAENAIVYDEKTSKPGQLVNQRSRWINTWFKYAPSGFRLAVTGLARLNWNQLLSGAVFTRPPLFILFFLLGAAIVLDAIYLPSTIYICLFGILGFLITFFRALHYYQAPKSIYVALLKIPIFIFYQVLSLVKYKKANELSTATEHYIPGNEKDENIR